MSYIKGGNGNEPLKPHFVKYPNAINEVRRVVLQLIQPLADIVLTTCQNIELMDDHLNDVIKTAEWGKTAHIPFINLEITKLNYPETVCVSCAGVVQVSFQKF